MTAVDLAVIGLGSAGRSAVELATALGASVVGIDRARVGGDCLWTGCVPSKTLIASARVAHAMRHARRFGIDSVEPVVDLAAIWDQIAEVQAAVAATDDDPDRLRALGAEIVIGEARITGDHEVTVGDRRIAARAVLVATGSKPRLPPIAGLEHASPLTTSEVFGPTSPFAGTAPPRRVVVLGAGAVGCELAQALRRLGIAVTLLESAPTVLPGEEAALAAKVTETLRDESVLVDVEVTVDEVRSTATGVELVGRRAGEACSWTADRVIVATGRAPVVDGIGLDTVGVVVGEHGIETDRSGRSSVDWVFAAGDCAGPRQLTPWAASAATVAVRAALLPGRATVEDVVPRCVFTDPELASVGLTTAAARAVHGDDVETWVVDVGELDRGRTDASSGAIVLVTAARQRLVGAHVLAPAAGEVIGQLALAVRDGRRLNHLAGLLQAYPTISSGIGVLAARAVYAKAARVGARAAARRSGIESG